jgi:hypothetical protein
MIRQLLNEIADPKSIYSEIIDNILRPNLHLKGELISELSISFLENEKKVNEVIKKGYFPYYFIRAVINNVRSSSSPFYKNTVIKDHIYFDNIEIEDQSDIDEKMEREVKYLRIDRAYTKIPKTYFQEFVFHEYYTKGKTYRQISNENENVFSHCLVYHEVSKIKKILKEVVENTK